MLLLLLRWLVQLLLITVMMTSLHCGAQDVLTEGPTSSGDGDCCGSRLIDSSSNRVVIETSQSLDDATYAAIRLRLCTRDPVAVQLWRRVYVSTYQLHWQTALAPTTNQTNAAYVTIRLTTPVNITFADRIGLYTATGHQLTIPFEPDQTASAYYSDDVIADASLTSGRLVSVGGMRWRRSFRKYVTFCLTPEAEAALSCDPSADVTAGMRSQTSAVEDMNDSINQLNDILNSLVSQNYVTGLCPQGFLSGSYGVGSCYLMFTNPTPMAQAVLTCRSYGALLLTIETSSEQNFIKNFVQNNTIGGGSNVIRFWTTGMYNTDEAAWLWYAGTSSQLTTHPASVTTKRIAYSHWLNHTTPIPTTVNDVCLIVAIDRQRSFDYWTNEYCYRQLATICEIPKRCL